MDAVKKWLKVNAISGAELGRRVGVSKAAVSLWLTGRQLPRGTVARKLAQVTGLSLDAIYAAPRKR